MKKRLLSLLTVALLIIITACSKQVAVNNEINTTTNDKDIAIIFTNDIHCGLTDNVGVPSMMKYYNDLDNEGVYKVLVDAGDFSQGNATGSVSKGESLSKLMSDLGYDFIVPGNHDFDYGYKKLLENSIYLTGKLYSCNIVDKKTGKPFFDGYKVFALGNKKVGFVGVTTPWTFTTTKPSNLKDENDELAVDFMIDDTGKILFDTIQKNIDAAKSEGADYVVLVGHIGETGVAEPYSMKTIVANLKDIDAVIDGHSHSIYNTMYATKDGKNIPAAQTGTKEMSFGRLNITKDGDVSIELIDKVDGKDPKAEKLINDLLEDIKKQTSAIIYKDNKINFTINDPETGKRAVRKAETNLGDFVADSMRYAGNSDIAFANGGSIRDNIKVGDITYNDIINVSPFFNSISTVKITGQQLLDFLELNSMNYPEEHGGFAQSSGFTYEIDGTKQTKVVCDTDGNFEKVDGEYRVKNVVVGDEPLDKEKLYTATANDFTIVECGGGCSMFKNAEMVNLDFTIDTEALADYFAVADMSKYQNPRGEGRIKIYG